MGKKVAVLIILLFNLSCKRHINEDDIKYMPYKSGDNLIFENQKNKSVDTIFISNIEKFVPDGPQIYFNETIKANNINGEYIVSLSSGYGKHSESYIRISGLSGMHYLKELNSKTEIKLKINTIKFDDVIIIEKKGLMGKIEKVFWSKSKGIVKYVMKDGTTYKLIKFKNRIP